MEQLTNDQLSQLSKESVKLRNLRKKSNRVDVDRVIAYLDTYLPNISIETLEDVVKEFKKREERLSREIIPTILNSCFLSKITLRTGEEIEVEEKLKASISDKNYMSAFRNMVNAYKEENNCSNELAEDYINELFKTKLIIEDANEDTYNILIDNNIPYDIKKDIHWQTLRKYCQNRLDIGKKIPEDINVFQYQETKIKEKK